MTGLPAGAVNSAGETPEDGCRRELMEETGYHAAEVIQVGLHCPNPATHNNRVHTYLAVGVTKVTDQIDPEEGIQVVRKPFVDYVKDIMEHPNTDEYNSLYLAACFLAINHIISTEDPRLSILRQRLCELFR